ncbi:MAG: hypothetical protein N2318_08295 [Meiothermus sp.]|nr:hypothetical protein [Meiothermus sp.]
MKKRKPVATSASPEKGSIASPQEARFSQAEIDNRAMSLYAKRYKVQPKEMRSLNREASHFYTECLKQASMEMGPAIEFGVGGITTPAVVTPEVQAVIDRLALLKASPMEQFRQGFWRTGRF